MTRLPALPTVVAAAAVAAVVGAAAAAAVPGAGARSQDRGPSEPVPAVVESSTAGSAPGPGGVAPAGPTVPSPGAGTAARDRARWHWPLRPRPPVLRPFRAPSSPYGPGHRGIDLATSLGARVLAVEGGTVTHAGVIAGRGTVTVRHDDGLSSTYEPVDPLVAAGSRVTTGDVLGTAHPRDGPGHCGPRVCLHLGAVRGGSYVDPYPLLAGGRLALLPVR